MNLKLKSVRLEWYLEKMMSWYVEKQIVKLPNVLKSKNVYAYEKEIRIPIFKARYTLYIETKNSKVTWTYETFTIRGTIDELELIHTKIIDICKSKAQALLYMSDEKLGDFAKAKIADFSDIKIDVRQIESDPDPDEEDDE